MSVDQSPKHLRSFARGYTQHAADTGELRNASGREKKALKIKAVLASHGYRTERPLCVLDLGCSHGWILSNFVVDGGCYVGIDLDHEAMKTGAKSVNFVVADAEGLPFIDNYFDVVLCNHVYEHTDNSQHLLQEIQRILKPEGLCYFSGPNKFSPIESHYGLPFLSWLPRPVADALMRISGKGNAYLWKPKAYGAIKRMLGCSGFVLTDYTKTIIDNPEKFHIEDILPSRSIKQRLAQFTMLTMPAIFPEFVFLLQKNTDALKP